LAPPDSVGDGYREEKWKNVHFVRSSTDSAETYVLGSNFPSFVRGHRDLFPAYFLEALSEPGT
jgi:hypothetical protein